MNKIKELIDKICVGYDADLEELESLIALERSEVTYLFEAADKVRIQYCGNEVQVRAIIEFSNYCRCLCAYCGLNAENKTIARYRMSMEEIVENAKEAIEAGYRTLVLQSGEDLWYTREMICTIVKEIKKIDDVAITLSMGERSYEDYKAFKEVGADRYLIKHETADEELYNSLHSHSSFKKRVQCLKLLKELGFQTGSGFMIGIPGQTYRTIAKDIMLLKEIGVHMAGIGPFIPHPLTPLKDASTGSTFNTLKAVAVARLVLKDAMLPATTSLGVVDSKSKNLVFSTGANVIMQKVEPYKYRRLYDIYPKPMGHELTIKEEREKLDNFILSCGREIGASRGDHGKLLDQF